MYTAEQKKRILAEANANGPMKTIKKRRMSYNTLVKWRKEAAAPTNGNGNREGLHHEMHRAEIDRLKAENEALRAVIYKMTLEKHGITP